MLATSGVIDATTAGGPRRSRSAADRTNTVVTQQRHQRPTDDGA